MNQPTVLLIDDETHIRLLIKRVLTNMNCEVVAEGKNGEEAVALFQQHSPHITFLDINMPVKSGIEALEEIKNIDPDALIIMLTSVDESSSVEKCRELGATNYIRKDTSLDNMKLIIKETWDKRSK